MRAIEKATKLLKSHECFHITCNQLPCRPIMGYNALITCEHGGSELPPGRPWHAQDIKLKQTHWAYDIGAGDFARDLSSHIRAPALINNFSRLIIDVNRPLDDETLFRSTADGMPVELNQDLNLLEKQRRIDRYYKPYHEELAYLNHLLDPSLILAIHSFTKNYEGNLREVEVGVLFNQNEELALEFEQFFRDQGYKVKLNEPWSGKEGFMYAVSQVESNRNKGIMLEFRNDLLVQEQWKHKMLLDLANLLNNLSHLRHSDYHPVIGFGDSIPRFVFSTLKNSKPSPVTTEELFKNKKAVLFGVPGAFTPVCSKEHLPGFIKNYDKLKKKVDLIACTSINDPYVMDAWNRSQGGNEKITMLADGNGDFSRLIGTLLNTYKSGMGTRSKRYAMILNDGIVKWMGIDNTGLQNSTAEAVLEHLD